MSTVSGFDAIQQQDLLFGVKVGAGSHGDAASPPFDGFFSRFEMFPNDKILYIFENVYI
jgi:hypothetical protein